MCGGSAELGGGSLPQKICKSHFRARCGSFECIQLLPLLAASVGIALHGIAGQILPEYGKQMQGLTVFVCKIAVLRLPGRIVQAITVDPVGQDRRLFRVCVDCDRKRRRACRCIAGCILYGSFCRNVPLYVWKREKASSDFFPLFFRFFLYDPAN